MAKTKLQNRNGVDYLWFTPEGMTSPTMLPVITKGSREKNNAWTWNGSLDKPTVRPSVRTSYTDKEGNQTEIHYWLNDGICDCLGDCKDGNAGKKLKLAELDEAFF